MGYYYCFVFFFSVEKPRYFGIKSDTWYLHDGTEVRFNRVFHIENPAYFPIPRHIYEVANVQVVCRLCRITLQTCLTQHLEICPANNFLQSCPNCFKQIRHNKMMDHARNECINSSLFPNEVSVQIDKSVYVCDCIICCDLLTPQ